MGKKLTVIHARLFMCEVFEERVSELVGGVSTWGSCLGDKCGGSEKSSPKLEEASGPEVLLQQKQKVTQQMEGGVGGGAFDG
ncbi:unnamed protein product [Boreogadus saida]